MSNFVYSTTPRRRLLKGHPPPPGLKPRCIVEFSNTLRYSDVYRSRKTVALNRFAELAAFRDIRDNLFAGLQL